MKGHKKKNTPRAVKANMLVIGFWQGIEIQQVDLWFFEWCYHSFVADATFLFRRVEDTEHVLSWMCLVRCQTCNISVAFSWRHESNSMQHMRALRLRWVENGLFVCLFACLFSLVLSSFV